MPQKKHRVSQNISICPQTKAINNKKAEELSQAASCYQTNTALLKNT
jgi:hypothetical protein